MNTCRSCGAEIIWAKTESGRRMPMDADPASQHRGLFTLIPGEDPFDTVALAVPALYQSHFATCPNADQHRKE